MDLHNGCATTLSMKALPAKCLPARCSASAKNAMRGRPPGTSAGDCSRWRSRAPAGCRRPSPSGLFSSRASPLPRTMWGRGQYISWLQNMSWVKALKGSISISLNWPWRSTRSRCLSRGRAAAAAAAWGSTSRARPCPAARSPWWSRRGRTTSRSPRWARPACWRACTAKGPGWDRRSSPG